MAISAVKFVSSFALNDCHLLYVVMCNKTMVAYPHNNSDIINPRGCYAVVE